MSDAIELSTTPMVGASSRQVVPLVAHVIHHLGVGGLENGLVNLINHMPAGRYRHAIVCLKGYSDFHKRLVSNDGKNVQIVALNKIEGKDPGLYLRLFKALRRLKPDIVHTRNLAAIEGQLIAALAGVSGRVHGEHGRDIYDLDGKNMKYRLLRKALLPFVGHFTAVSKDLENWLVESIGAPQRLVSQIYNGVDSVRFHSRDIRQPIGPAGFMESDSVIVGSVGRMASVKNFPLLVRSFLMLLEKEPESRRYLRLLIVGDGESRNTCIEMLRNAGAASLAWLPGERDDVAELMRSMDVFVLPSLAEGTSNTILEAMASGLPVIATRVGGNTELVEDDVTGRLVPSEQPMALAAALHDYCHEPAMRLRQGSTARRRIEARFSVESMTKAYLDVYDNVLSRKCQIAKH